MHMPQLTEQHNKLKAFVGEWTGQDIIHPAPWNPQGATAKSRVSSKLMLDGFFLVSEYTQERDGKVTYRGHGVYGYDAMQKKYTLHWFDSMGIDPGPPALGDWNGDTVVFTHQHVMGHGRMTYDFSKKDALSFKLEKSQDGKNWTLFIEATYKRT
jgi:hypothetical protein